MSSDFGYINARVRGMKSRLLGPEFYAQALGDTDYRAFLASLGQTPYSAQLEESQGLRAGLGVVDRAIAENFRDTARSLLGFSDGRPHDLIAIFLLNYDLLNLKALARAKHSGRDADEVRSSLLPAGELKPALLDTLAGAADLPAMAQALAVTGHPLSRAFSRAVRRYASSNSLFEFELELDRSYYAAILEALEDAGAPDEVVRFVRRQIDAVNLATALKVRGNAPRAADLFLPGGREIDRAAFDAVVGDESQGALSVVSGTSFGDVAKADTLAAADRVIRTVLDTAARRLALKDPLGPGVVLDYLRRKESEAARLRLLARGKYYEIPRPQLEKELGHA